MTERERERDREPQDRSYSPFNSPKTEVTVHNIISAVFYSFDFFLSPIKNAFTPYQDSPKFYLIITPTQSLKVYYIY